uniref:Uncharacterized protein n=1 Tax=Hyaloperonospora arabidopsidis (strain Emoy2) TaxID=559515 RepID=M4B6S7_HYAAE
MKIALRNTSRKKREYVIQVDQSFTVPNLRPTFYFSIDETPATVITQAQEKKLDEELEKLEHKLRIAETKKKVDKIVKLNVKISQVKALLSGEQIPINSDGESMGRSEESSEVGACEPNDSANSESELSESESSSRSQRRRSRHSDKHFVDVKTGVSSRTNTLHFSLEAETTGKVVAYAIFNPIKSGDNSLASREDGNKREACQRKEMKKRQLRRDATTIVGMGKFLLFEQQNKDVVKELQYNAEIFLRTPAGENAFCRAVGRKLPSTLPPHPHNGTGVSIMDENILKSRTGKPRDVNGGSVSQVDDVSSSMAASVEAKSAVSKHRHSLTIEIPDSGKMVQKLNVDIASSQCCPFPTSSSLLVLAEESPSGTRGWPVTLTLGSPSFQGSAVIEIAWNPASTFKNVMTLTCNTVLPNFLAQDDKAAIADEAETRGRQLLPVKLNIPVDRTVSLDLKWCFTSDAGFAPSTPLAACVSRSVLESVSEAAELNAGTIDFFYCSRNSSPQERHQGTTTHARISSLNVVVVKTAQRSLCFEDETIDLGERQQGEDIRGEVVIHNRLQQALQYLLLVGSRDPSSSSIPSSVSPLLVGGELTFENATGTVPAESFVRATFVYKGSVPGQHKEQIVLRNLSGDRLDTSVLTLSVRIVRPVYVRIPELDPQVTGQLEVLDLGPCYVTPEMQDTAVDSPNGSFRFSKVHKLTLHSQVEHTLVVCASSNLKTQCYVYEDAHLQREATHVVMKGMHVIDLYVAIRPRLSSDAIKTGSTRELVGGIRVQLFGLLAQDDTLGDEKSDMLTEFTVKFVGVAGASIARIAPPLIDFGVEYNSGRMQTCQTHEGHFELVNMSKALPLKYRLYVTNATEGYSDDDDSLHLSLKHEKGEIPANETGKIEFRMMAYTNGLFRRRIMVDNINYPGKAHSVDVLLFVDSGALSCEVAVSEIDGHIRQEKSASASCNALNEPVLVQSVDLGLINVIRLEEELSDTTRVSGDSDPSSCKYRIYGKCDDVPFIKARSTANSLLRLPGEKTLVLTNTTDRVIVVRPFSTLPMTFRWKQKGHDDCSASEKVNTRFASMEDVRRLCVPRLGSDTASQKTQQSSVFYGDSSALDANSTVQLSFRFAPIAVTAPLPIETIESGQLCPFRGMIGIQSFETSESEDGEEACTLKVVNVSGLYGEPRFHIAQKHIALGKIGYAIGWKSSTFTISVKNVSDVAVSFILANLPAFIHVCNVRDARRIESDDGIDLKAIQRFPSLQMLALHAEQLLENEHGVSWTAWGLQPRTTCVLEMELFLIAGNHEFLLRFFNLCNPSNRENVLVRAQIISSYAELVIDPANADKGMETADSKEDHVAFLPPVTVPASLEAPLHRASFWFSLRNVYDEELSVRLSSQTHSPFDRTIELLLMLRSAHTPLSSIVISPGESVDIRVVCHVFPAARLLPDTWPSGISGATSDILDLGRVLLDINIRNAEEAAQQKEIRVKGKFLPGKTFLLSASSLHFFATATDLPAHISASQLPPNLASNAGGRRDSSQTLSTETSQQTTTCVVHQLRNSFESFWVRNPSTVDVLDFAISPVSMYQPGLCLVKGSAEADMCAMSEWIQAIAVPSSGTIAPNESLKITVRLEEATPTSVDPFHDGNDDSTPGKIAPQHTVRRNPTWRSNSWDADALEKLPDEGGSYHMSLIVRDIDSNLDTAVSTVIDVLLVLQQQSSSSDSGNQGNVILDTNLITTALSARNDRLAQPRKLCPRPSLKTHVENEFDGQSESPGSDTACKFNVSSSRSEMVEQNDYLPVMVVRGCTPAEYSSLENTRYLIDVGQHTVRNGGEVEWEITIESLFGSVADDGLDSVEYHLMIVDKAARSWLQLSRERESGEPV